MFTINHPYLRKLLLLMGLLLLFTVSTNDAPAQEAAPDKEPMSIQTKPLLEPTVAIQNTASAVSPSGDIFCGIPYVPIPDNIPSGITDTIVITQSDIIEDLNIGLAVAHTWVGDLRFTLTHQETGTSVTFFDRPGVPASGAGCNGDDIEGTLDDEASTPVEDECSPGIPTISGSHIPNNPLAAFDGEQLSGTWVLTASDNAFDDIGTLEQWCLDVVAATNTANLTIVNDAEPADGTDFLFTSDLPTATYLNQWGSMGNENGQFTSPIGVAVDMLGNVFVADAGNNRIQKFDANGNFLLQWGSSGNGNGEFNTPDGIAIDSAGNIYVTEFDGHRIQKFANNGTYLNQWGSMGSGNGELFSPEGIAVDATGNVYVVDSDNHRIQKFTNDGTYLAQWGSMGSEDGQFNGPSFIVVDADNNVYVTDTSNSRVQEFTSDGTYVTKWGSLGTGDGQFNGAEGIAVDAFGHVYVVDLQNNRVQKFTNNGLYLSQWGSVGTGEGQFNNPQAIAIDAQGNMYVSDRFNHRVQLFAVNAFFLDDAVPDDGDGINNMRVFEGLLAGSYDITEMLSDEDWSLTDIVCDGGNWSADLGSQTLSITLAEGDDVTCTFRNDESEVVEGFFAYLPLVTSGLEPIVPETTEVLTAETADLLADISADGSEFTFEGSNSQLNSLEAGDIIMSDPTDAAANGFLRMVEEVSMVDGNVMVETALATLEEAIEQGSASGHKKLTPADVQSAVLRPGVQMMRTSGSNIDDSFTFSLNNVVLYDHDGDVNTTNDQLKANGSFEFAVEFDVNLVVRNFEVKKLDFSTTVEEEVTIELFAEANVASFEGAVPIADLHLGTYTVWIGPAPVVFTIELPIALKADGSLSVGVTTGVTQSATFTGGILYKRGVWSTYEYSNWDFTFNPPTPYVGVELRGYLEPKLQLKLYGVAGPYATIEPYVKFVAATNQTPWWKLSAGIEAKVGVEIEVFGHSLGADTELALGYDVILAQAQDSAPPYLPSSPEPPDMSNNQPTDLELIWSGGDPDGDDVTYTIYLEAGDATPEDIACAGMSADYCYVEGLVYNTLYYWQVKATDSNGASTWGPVWRFTTQATSLTILNSDFESDSTN